jgi:hypothetical protein
MSTKIVLVEYLSLPSSSSCQDLLLLYIYDLQQDTYYRIFSFWIVVYVEHFLVYCETLAVLCFSYFGYVCLPSDHGGSCSHYFLVRPVFLLPEVDWQVLRSFCPYCKILETPCFSYFGVDDCCPKSRDHSVYIARFFNTSSERSITVPKNNR